MAPDRTMDADTQGGLAWWSAHALTLMVLLSTYLPLCLVLSLREHAARWEPRPHGAAAGSSADVVPRIIHQMYKTTAIPSKWADAAAQWRAMHPPPEYTYILWTDETLRELVATEYAWLLPTYDAYPHATQRWDASRYCVLHKYGGVYADLDLAPITPIDEMLRGQRLLLPHTPNIGLTNAFMAATPRHPFVSHLLSQLPTYAQQWYHHLGRHATILSSAGPTFVWAVHMGWARDHGVAQAAALLPAADWGKCSYCRHDGGGGGGGGSDAHAVGDTVDDAATPPSSRAWQSPLRHGVGSSWHAADSRAVLFLFCHLHELGALGLWLLIAHRARTRPRRSRFMLLMAVAIGAVLWLQLTLGLVLIETFLCRPVVWLIMS